MPYWLSVGKDDKFSCLDLHVTHEKGTDVHCQLSLRPSYCDRGHIQLLIDGDYIGLDYADSFPRFFFSFEEADKHTREFLKWRLWKHRTYDYASMENMFKNFYPYFSGVSEEFKTGMGGDFKTGILDRILDRIYQMTDLKELSDDMVDKVAKEGTVFIKIEFINGELKQEIIESREVIKTKN